MTTPMQSLRVQQENMLSKMDASVFLSNLNKKSPSYYYDDCYNYVETNGVKSDFIRIFSEQGYKDLSFAFSFSYMKVEMGKENVHIVIKDTNKPADQIYSSSKVFLIEEMREKLKELNRAMKVRQEEVKRNLSLPETIALIKVIFNFNETESDFEEFVASFKSQNKQIINERAKLSKQFKADKENYDKSLIELDTFEKELPEQEEIKELEKQISKLKNSIRIKTAMQREKLEIDTQCSNLRKLKQTVLNMNNETIQLFKKLNTDNIKYRFNESRIVDYVKKHFK